MMHAPVTHADPLCAGHVLGMVLGSIADTQASACVCLALGMLQVRQLWCDSPSRTKHCMAACRDMIERGQHNRKLAPRLTSEGVPVLPTIDEVSGTSRGVSPGGTPRVSI